MKFFISIVLILFMLCIVGLSGFVLWGSKGSVRVGRVPLDVLEVGSGPLKHSGEVRHLSFLSWNIAFLYGEGSEGTGYTPKDEEFYYQKLDKIESIFQKYPFDIGFFQEVDLDAERSHGMDQSVGLQWKGGQFYGSSILSWDVRYMPFPYFPFSSHWGKIRSGGAITSHFPLDEGFAQILEKPDYNWFYRSFYLHRYIQEAVISVDGIKYMIFNVHLEAFDQKNDQ